MNQNCLQIAQLIARKYCTSELNNTTPKSLYKYLLRQCEQLPDGAKKYYKFMVKQSFKQHVNESDPERIKQIVARSYEDAKWVLKKTKSSSMNQIPLATSSTVISSEDFWRSVLIHHDRPNLVNRRLATVAQVLFCQISLHAPNVTQVSDIFTREALLHEIRKLPNLKSFTTETIKSIAETYDKQLNILETNREVFNESFEGIFVSVRILIGRQKLECPEIVIFDKKNKTATFFALQEQEAVVLAPQFPYHIELNRDGNLRVTVNSFEDADTGSAEWLADKLFPKLLKWVDSLSEADTGIKSLNLIAAEDYYTLYIDLKAKYGKGLVEVWAQNAKTDPAKYIYEDIAIATYLICLWRKLEVGNVTFVDCGCGNGLLVYVLNREGYKGYGLDVRKRKIWEIFPVDLRVETVTPASVFPEATWIIGNHSDELTPWIPVIATRSSPCTNYFVLPCCTYDFSGQKYIRMDTSKSQYTDYLEYIENISVRCGFNTSVDKLRIPSTRRICLVGVRDVCNKDEVDKINLKVDKFIDARSPSEFHARKSVEKVRNCTKLDQQLISRIINIVVGALLTKENCMTNPSNGKSWNRGGVATLSNLIEKIPNEDLKLLKNECGGMQTLLKNHKYIFQLSGGFVSLRIPLSVNDCDKYRDKPCWFHRNHRDGCFYEDETCAYKHQFI